MLAEDGAAARLLDRPPLKPKALDAYRISMEFENVTFIGPPPDDPELLDELPQELVDILRQTNGLVAFRGGLHLRGACRFPTWHALRSAWRGPDSVAAHYRAVEAEDVPFAQDALGDQFVLRRGHVFRLSGETGDLEPLGATLDEFLAAACADPVGYLHLGPLQQFEAEGKRLEPGQLLSVYPPFCTHEAANGVSLQAVSVADRLGSLAALVARLEGLPEGARLQFKVEP